MSNAKVQVTTDMARVGNEDLGNAEPRTPESTTPTTFRKWCWEELKSATFD